MMPDPYEPRDPYPEVDPDEQDDPSLFDEGNGEWDDWNDEDGN